MKPLIPVDQLSKSLTPATREILQSLAPATISLDELYQHPKYGAILQKRLKYIDGKHPTVRIGFKQNHLGVPVSVQYALTLGRPVNSKYQTVELNQAKYILLSIPKNHTVCFNTDREFLTEEVSFIKGDKEIREEDRELLSYLHRLREEALRDYHARLCQARKVNSQTQPNQPIPTQPAKAKAPQGLKPQVQAAAPYSIKFPLLQHLLLNFPTLPTNLANGLLSSGKSASYFPLAELFSTYSSCLVYQLVDLGCRLQLEKSLRAYRLDHADEVDHYDITVSHAELSAETSKSSSLSSPYSSLSSQLPSSFSSKTSSLLSKVGLVRLEAPSASVDALTILIKSQAENLSQAEDLSQAKYLKHPTLSSLEQANAVLASFAAALASADNTDTLSKQKPSDGHVSFKDIEGDVKENGNWICDVVGVGDLEGNGAGDDASASTGHTQCTLETKLVYPSNAAPLRLITTRLSRFQRGYCRFPVAIELSATDDLNPIFTQYEQLHHQGYVPLLLLDASMCTTEAVSLLVARGIPFIAQVPTDSLLFDSVENPTNVVQDSPAHTPQVQPLSPLLEFARASAITLAQEPHTPRYHLPIHFISGLSTEGTLSELGMYQPDLKLSSIYAHTRLTYLGLQHLIKVGEEFPRSYERSKALANWIQEHRRLPTAADFNKYNVGLGECTVGLDKSTVGFTLADCKLVEVAWKKDNNEKLILPADVPVPPTWSLYGVMIDSVGTNESLYASQARGVLVFPPQLVQQQHSLHPLIQEFLTQVAISPLPQDSDHPAKIAAKQTYQASAEVGHGVWEAVGLAMQQELAQLLRQHAQSLLTQPQSLLNLLDHISTHSITLPTHQASTPTPPHPQNSTPSDLTAHKSTNLHTYQVILTSALTELRQQLQACSKSRDFARVLEDWDVDKLICALAAVAVVEVVD